MNENIERPTEIEQIRKRVRDKDEIYLNFSSARGVDYRSAVQLGLIVILVVVISILASMNAEWWVYLLTVIIFLFLIWLVITRI